MTKHWPKGKGKKMEVRYQCVPSLDLVLTVIGYVLSHSLSFFGIREQMTWRLMLHGEGGRAAPSSLN